MGKRIGKENRRMKDLMIKYSILSWTTITLSMGSLLLYLQSHITLAIELNIPISVICVMLLHAKYERIYRKCCNPCIRLCHLNCKKINERKVAQMIMISSEKPETPVTPTQSPPEATL